MSITMNGLLAADTAALRAVAGRWEHVVAEIDATVDDLADATRDLPHHWIGESGDAAQESSVRLQTQVGNARYHCDTIRAAISRLADQFDEYKLQLSNVVIEARSRGLLVDGETGRVSLPPDAVPVEQADGVRLAQTATVDAYGLQIEEILSRANVADRYATATVEESHYHELERPSDELPAIDPEVVLASTGYSPDVRAQWWHDQHPLNRERIIADYPDVVGVGVGLPTTVRDEANRLLMAQQKEVLLARRQRLDEARDGAGGRAVLDVERGLADIAEAEHRLAADPDARLLDTQPPHIGKPDPKWDNYP